MLHTKTRRTAGLAPHHGCEFATPGSPAPIHTGTERGRRDRPGPEDRRNCPGATPGPGTRSRPRSHGTGRFLHAVWQQGAGRFRVLQPVRDPDRCTQCSSRRCAPARCPLSTRAALVYPTSDRPRYRYR
jgi:hypothetical protein